MSLKNLLLSIVNCSTFLIKLKSVAKLQFFAQINSF
nr:MAG TPA: hypothetical protein [Caudoviricetes sp.]